MAVDLVIARLIAPLIADTTEWNKGFRQATKTSTDWSEKVKSAVIDQGTKLIFDGAKMAARGVLDLGKAMARMVTQAAPLPAIGASFRAMAGQVDLSLDALRTAAAGTISDFDLMRKANIALTGSGADLAQAFGKDLPALLEGARAAARSTGQDVGFLFESLVSGVKRASPMLIDNTGIVLKLGEANQALANELGKSVEQLTAQEKSIAILNATVEASGKLVAQLGSDELTAAEQLQRFNAILQNTRDQIGIGLQPVLGNFVGRMTDLSERVLPPLVSFIETKVAPALDLIVDAMGNAAEAAVDAGDSFVGKFGARLSQAADSALRWGIQISTELATGLVKGAASALTAAMQFIGNMLATWLAPGSPPKVAPKLDRWGGEWMAELLRGMTEADFGVLEKIQGPLSKVLSGPAFKNISGEIIEALSTGDAGPALFDKIAASAGKFGNEIAELARRQVALAKATNEVKAAEEGLAKAREQQSKAAETVDALADEFNKLLAAGADPAILDAKRAEFDAAKDSLSLADQEVAAAEDRKTAVEESLSPLQEQVLLQDKLLDQLFKLSTVGESAMEKIKAGIAGLAGIGAALASLPTPKLPAPDFSAVTAAFTEAKGNLFAKFADLFAPVTEAWEKEIKPTLDGLKEEWGKFTGIVKQFWDEKVVGVIEEIKKFLPPDLIEKLGEWAGKTLVVAAAVGILLGLLTILTSPIVLLVVGITALILLWEVFGEQITTTVQQLVAIVLFKLLEWQQALFDLGTKIAAWALGIKESFLSLMASIVQTWEDIKTGVRDKIDAMILGVSTKIAGLFTLMGLDLGSMKERWATIWEDVTLIASEVWDRISAAVLERLTIMLSTLREKMEIIGTFWSEKWDAVSTKVSEIWTAISTVVGEKSQDLFDTVTGNIQAIMDWITDQATVLIALGEDLIGGIQEGVLKAAGSLIKAVTGAVESAISAAKKLLGIDSPSRIFLAIGASMMEGMALGIETHANEPAMSAINVSRDVSIETSNFFNQTINTNAGEGVVTMGFNQMRSMVQAT